MQLSHKTKSHWEVVLSNTFHSVVKCFDVMQNIIDIFWNIYTRLHFCLDRINHSCHRALDLALGCRIFSQVHAQKEIYIRQKFCYTVELAKETGSLVDFFQNFWIKFNPTLRRKGRWNKGLESFLLFFKLANFYRFHVCLHVIINVSKVYTFAYIKSSNVNKPNFGEVIYGSALRIYFFTI